MLVPEIFWLNPWLPRLPPVLKHNYWLLIKRVFVILFGLLDWALFNIQLSIFQTVQYSLLYTILLFGESYYVDNLIKLTLNFMVYYGFFMVQKLSKTLSFLVPSMVQYFVRVLFLIRFYVYSTI